MAETVMLKHKETGTIKTGFYGFSWTTFFFGAFPALFRQDFITFIGAFVIMVIIGLITFGVGGWIAMFCWAFMYNKYYTQRLLERGYIFNDSLENVRKACAVLGVTSLMTEPMNTTIDASSTSYQP